MYSLVSCLVLPCLLLTSAPLGGCVAWEIRDEIRRSNQEVGAINQVVNETSNRLAQTDADLARTNVLLQDVLTEVTRTNAQLTRVQASLDLTQQLVTDVNESLERLPPHLLTANDGLERLRILEQIHASLSGVNAQLVPLSKAMGSVGGALSFLGAGSSRELAADEGTPAAPQPAESAGADAAAASSSPISPIVGTWVLVYPPVPDASRSAAAEQRHPLPHAMILQQDGRAVLDRQDRSAAAASWSRNGRTLRFAFAQEGTSADQPSAVEIEIVSLTSKTLGVRSGDELHIYSRP